MVSPCRTSLKMLVVVLAASAASSLAAQTGTDRSSDANSPVASNDGVLARVNGEPITRGDVELLMISRQVPDKLRDSLRKRFLEQLIDRRLMRAYLAERKAEPNPVELDDQVERIFKLIRKHGDDPQEVLSRLGYTEETLRRELALPLAWKTHLRRVVTDNRLRDDFQKHRRQFDGTKRRARQILIKVSAPDAAPASPAKKAADGSDIEAAKGKLDRIRQEILDGTITFAQAARKYSQAPSAEQGGDVGYFSYRGPMPEAFTRPIFELKVGEVSRPFVTPFGVHLVQVTEEKPGQLSLEDARPQVLEQLSEELWNQTVRDLRSKAKIERTNP